MDEIKIEVWDATGNKRQLVEVPHDAEVNRLIAVLIDRMNLPRHSPDGQVMSYKFHHKGTGQQLLDTDTLASASVEDGDILRLQPEITAGASSLSWMPRSSGGIPMRPSRASASRWLRPCPSGADGQVAPACCGCSPWSRQ